MSGRKSTEVNGLLARGKDARNAGKSNYNNKIHTAQAALEKNQEKIKSISYELSAISFQINDACKNEFPEESKRLKKQYEKLIKQNRTVNYQADITRLGQKKEQLEKELMDADRQGERIRERIKNKDWYCDEEYKDASLLLKTYQRITKEKNNLAASADQAVQSSRQDLIASENLKAQLKSLELSCTKLKERADSIVALRAKATEAKSYVNQMYSEIDAALAKKFLPEEYFELGVLVGEFSGYSDAQAVKQVTEMTEKLSLYSGRLQELHSRFLEQQASAKEALDANRQLLSADKNFYFEPIDYFKNKEKAKKIPLLDYLAEFGEKEEMIRSIQEGVADVERLIKEENFTEAVAQALKNTEQIEQAAAYTSVLQEHLIENFYVARDIKSVMIKMGFETGAVKRDGNLKNGWRITAKNPSGESIDFNRVFINDDGEVKIDIDHKTMGSCPSKWEDICSQLDDVGIFIEKIDMENGGNVLDKRKGKQSSANESKQEYGVLN